MEPDSLAINPLFTRSGEAKERPRFALADDEMLPETAYQIVHDEAMLDGNARQIGRASCRERV